jgi:hypothetical protein
MYARERFHLILLLILGLAPRLLMASLFPTIPISDFHDLVSFGVGLRDQGLLGQLWFWEYLSPGLPLILCSLFHLFRHLDPATVARWATAAMCGLLPLPPFLIWRGLLPLWSRVLAGVALALWPGQILFSGVVAQDNWVLLPTVALGALAVRSLMEPKSAQPLAAGLLYAAAVVIRQEMLVVLFPAFVAAGRRRIVAALLSAGLPLFALASYRWAATGRFALNSVHAGSAILSSYIPGAVANAYADPYPYTASVRPDLLRDRKAFFAEALHLAMQEALRRPKFHALRILSWVSNFAVSGEAVSLYWSIGADVLPEPIRARGAAVGAVGVQWLRYEMAAIQALFLAAVIIAIRRRNAAILILASAVFLKYAFHGLTATQGRYFFAATALELLGIVVAIYEVRSGVGARLAAPALAAGVMFGAVLFVFAPRLAAYVQARDVDSQRTYRFIVEPRVGAAELACTVNRGILVSVLRDKPLKPSWRGKVLNATIRTFDRDPAPGDYTAAVCELSGAGEARPLVLQVLDPYAPGGLPDRMVQRVTVNGVEVYSHDIGRDAGSGWADIPLGKVGAGTRSQVVIEVKAIKPDPGAAWGYAAATTFQLVSKPE